MQRFAPRCVFSAPGSASPLAGLAGGDAPTAVSGGAKGRGGEGGCSPTCAAAAGRSGVPVVGTVWVTQPGGWGSAQASSRSIRRVPPVPPDPPGRLLLRQAVPRGRGSCGSQEGPSVSGSLPCPCAGMCLGCLCCRQDTVPLKPGLSLSISHGSRGFLGRAGCLGSWMSGEERVPEGLWVPGESIGAGGFCWIRLLFLQRCSTNPAGQSRPHTRDAGQGLDGQASGQEQEQRDVSSPPAPVPAQRGTEPAPAPPLARHVSPHQPDCSSGEGLQLSWAEKQASDSRLREKNPSRKIGRAHV